MLLNSQENHSGSKTKVFSGSFARDPPRWPSSYQDSEEGSQGHGAVPSLLGQYFHSNKPVWEEITVIPSRKICNKIAGAVCHPSDEAGSERPWEIGFHEASGRYERRDHYVPEVSVLDQIMKFILKPRKCWSSWSLAVFPTHRSLSLPLAWRSKHHVEPCESFLLCSNTNKPSDEWG